MPGTCAGSRHVTKSPRRLVARDPRALESRCPWPSRAASETHDRFPPCPGARCCASRRWRPASSRRSRWSALEEPDLHQSLLYPDKHRAVRLHIDQAPGPRNRRVIGGPHGAPAARTADRQGVGGPPPSHGARNPPDTRRSSCRNRPKHECSKKFEEMISSCGPQLCGCRAGCRKLARSPWSSRSSDRWSESARTVI
jgi:hypothetical protein